MEIELRIEGRSLVFAAKEKDQVISTLSLKQDISDNGVAIFQICNAFTKGIYRRRGYMDANLKEVFTTLQAEREPFVFLGTREPEIFENKYGFKHIIAPKDPFPDTLGRIVDVRSFISYFSNDKEFVLSLRVYDDMLIENDGIYFIHCSPDGGVLTPVKIANPKMTNGEGEKIAAEAEVSVDDLIQFAFGLKTAKEAFKIVVPIKEAELCENLDKLKFDIVMS